MQRLKGWRVPNSFTAFRILLVHNRYQHRGGEDSVFEAEAAMLSKFGHVVETFEKENSSINAVSKLKVAVNTFWSVSVKSELEERIKKFRPDVIHVHNTFPIISPAIYSVAQRYEIPIIQTLHNFRLFCPQAMFLREGAVCEDCLGHVPWRGVMRGCYRESIAQSAVLAGMVTVHWALGTWQQKVTRYIALNDFCRSKFIEGGLPAEKVVVKPNFVDFPMPPEGDRCGFLFVGRLSREKGIDVLVSASNKFSDEKVFVAGTGPEVHLLNSGTNIHALGALSGEQVRDRMATAKALLLPSIWYENFPRTLVEAFGCGLPVIASRIGALAELVEDGVTGLLFEPGNSEDLASKMRWALNNPDSLAQMGRAARRHYEKNFTIERNYEQLVAIYADAIREMERKSHE